MNRKLFFIILTVFACSFRAGAATTATINDAWWTFQQDCDGDGRKAGTLPNNFARLNWDPNVVNCNGTLSVFEKIYSKPCASSSYSIIATTAVHSITGCRSSDQQFLDIQLSAGGVCHDFKIEIYRAGQSSADDILSQSNDADLNDHSEELLSEDTCGRDNFATAEILTGAAGTVAANNSSATKEAGEPNHAGNDGGKSLWYYWKAPSTKSVTFDTVGSDFDSVLAVYTGATLTNLSLVTSNDDIAGANNRQSRVTFNAVSNTMYRIAVDGFGGAGGNLLLNWIQTSSALPDLIFWGPAVSPEFVTQTFASNDCQVIEGCAIAGTRKLLRFNTETRNIGAGNLVMGDPSTNSLFHYASCHGHYHFEDFAIYRVRDTNGIVVALGNKVGFCLLDDHAWSATANPTRIYDCNNQGIQAGWADVYFSSLNCQFVDITGVPPGNYTLELEVDPEHLIAESNEENNIVQVSIIIPGDCGGPPPNDNFANRIALTGPPPVNVLQLNSCATKEASEPNHAGSAGAHSIWYSWTPLTNGTAIISTEGSGFDTLLGIYTGTSVSSLTVVTNNDDIGGGSLESRVTFNAKAGTNYQIAIDGYKAAGDPGEVGLVSLSINPPGNNDFAGRYVLSGTTGTTNGFNIGATKEFDEPAHASNVGGHSIWYLWVAPTNGAVEFNTVGSSIDTVLAIYTGTALTNIMSVASDNDSGPSLTSRAGFSAVTGTTYRIAVDGYGGASGNIVLNWNMISVLGAAHMPNGQVRVILTGVNAQRYQIQSSPNMSNWTPLTTITMSGGAQSILDVANGTWRFYRAMLVP